ncbi:hypothetical protein CHGG_08596 [Chaetomium globosum CBS 148.51]|uniref:Uncharacterized protein n=1 Tax=Chaetomium globosum (strain ATCC 6205 / CBS 148.51 / DSM 1962 / NBRC 6347 / NRRL 1970) TaxID=306901 RepID=Q2GTV8_CHAGB|nr:uncharacterized protein CHGG_08596 [Chaetomium globosum CBS 148.51]EAQ84582.1 hypothetical protein CHGG_08596 [Chaetomium globosum CBS 148.51]
MLDSLSVRLGLLLGGALVSFILVLRKLYPKPYPGIPYNEASARRITGDMMDFAPIIQKTNEISDALFTVTTQKLGTPIAQVLFPGFRKPIILLEDPREIEDIIFTTPALKAQKRLWADTMSMDFLRRVAAPNIHKSTCELIELWRLKSSTKFKNQAFNVHSDFKDAALDAIWAVIVGEEPGTIQHDIKTLEDQMAGKASSGEAPSIGSFLKEQVSYIMTSIARNGNTPSPKWAQKLETYTPRYRKFRRVVKAEMHRAMETAVERYKSLEVARLEDDAADTCAMDLVLRRQILQARKAGVAPSDPTKDENMLDEMFSKPLSAPPCAPPSPPPPPPATTILNADIPYLDATCEETLRLSGTAKGSLRQALVDTHILGCPVPRGAEILMNYHVNRAPPGEAVDEGRRSATSRAAGEKRGDGLRGVAGRDLGVFEPRRWTEAGDDGTEDYGGDAGVEL